MKSVYYSCRGLKELELSQKIIEKYTNTKCHENLSSESRVVTGGTDGWTDGQTDEHDAAKSRFSQFFGSP